MKYLESLIKRINSSPLPVKILFLLVWVGGIFLGIQFIVAFFLSFLFRNFIREPVFIGFYSIISFVLATYLIIFLPSKLKKTWKTNREELGLTGLPTWTDILLSPIAFAAFFLISIVLNAIFQFFPWFNPNEVQNIGFGYSYSIFSRIIAFTVLVIIAPIIEELIFRGWLYAKLRSRLSLVPSILLTSLLFATLHGQWNVSINVFALSLILCIQREITGTIYSSILLHMFKNGIAFLVLFML